MIAVGRHKDTKVSKLTTYYQQMALLVAASCSQPLILPFVKAIAR